MQPTHQPELPPMLKPLTPLFEDPAACLENHLEQFYMTTGGMGRMVNLTPDAVTFAWVNNGDATRYYPERTSAFDTLIEEPDDRNTIVVTSEADARRKNQPATWKKIDCDQLYIYERVPFESVVESVSELQSELDRIMENPPDLESEFMANRTSMAENDALSVFITGIKPVEDSYERSHVEAEIEGTIANALRDHPMVSNSGNVRADYVKTDSDR